MSITARNNLFRLWACVKRQPCTTHCSMHCVRRRGLEQHNWAKSIGNTICHIEVSLPFTGYKIHFNLSLLSANYLQQNNYIISRTDRFSFLCKNSSLTHWRMTPHICVSKRIIIGAVYQIICRCSLWEFVIWRDMQASSLRSFGESDMGLFWGWFRWNISW